MPQLKYRDVFIVLTFAFYAFVLMFGLSALLPTRGTDASTIERLAYAIADNRIDGSYQMMAFLFARTNATTRVLIEVVLATGFFLICFGPVRRLPWLSLIFFLMIPPIVFFLTQFIKDTMLVAFVLAAAMTFRTRWPEWVKIGVVCLIYIGYAVFMRQYYYLIVVAFVGLCVLRTLPAPLQIATVMVGLVALAFVPADVFQQLQDTRDMVNANRIGRDIAGARTAFVNPWPSDNYLNFLGNYGYAALRLHLPFLFGSVRVQEVFLLANIAAYASLAWVGLRSGIKSVQTPALLIVAHVLVLILFEPDLSSYLRHLGSVLPYAIPAIVFLEWRRDRAAGTDASPSARFLMA